MKRRMSSFLKGLLFTGLAMVMAFGAVVLPNNTPAKAETVSELRAQAAALQAQINENAAKAKELAKEADSLKRKVAEYDLQISGVSTQIELTTVKIAELEESLKQAQIELDRQKALLKTAIRALYKKGDASSFELLVGSASFSQFINEQDYLERLKEGIQTSTEKVIELKLQIKAQKEEQEKLLIQQEEQKKALDASRAERQDVLNYTKGQETAYRQMVNSLKQQQIDINRKIFAQSGAQIFAGDPNKGGYPSYLANAGHDALIDPWGMFNRECVSYTAWRVHNKYMMGQSSRDMPTNWPWYYGQYGPGHGGNARDWLGDAAVDGIPYDQNPRPGDIGILRSGEYGHAVYVEDVYDDGRIYISQYNYDWNGHYSEAIMTPNSLWYFIHF
ncbi:MAG: CHAP domain-containing protein [Patescibacteria group bacterium]